jgi:Tetratricopeptide Repeats-Sensor
MANKPTCFVVMGFREKTDPVSGKTFDLDKSYRILIKPAVQAAGATCVRADDIVHAEVIDIPMYEQLLQADLVVADLSTLNANAFFELGVRYALRRRATIAIAESGFKNPFDTNHIATLPYEHLGKGIDAEEAKRFKAKLTKLCKTVLNNARTDSPVYTYIRDLQPPRVPNAVELTESAAAYRAAPGGSGDTRTAKPLAQLMDLAMDHRREGNFLAMRQVLAGVVAAMGDRPDAFAVQQLALATYKSKAPEPVKALTDAKEVLAQLDPEAANDPETLGIWGAIHKRLAEHSERSAEQQEVDLNTAIFAYEKGYYLKDDYYNGINLAFLLDTRAAKEQGDDRIADRVQARRVRERLARRLEQQIAEREGKENSEELRAEAYWMRATMAEAHAGLGNAVLEQDWLKKAGAFKPEPWMVTTTAEQIAKLRALLAATGS